MAVPSQNERGTTLGTATGEGPGAGLETTTSTGLPGATWNPACGIWPTIRPGRRPVGQLWPIVLPARPAMANLWNAAAKSPPTSCGTETGLLTVTGTEALAVAPLLSATVSSRRPAGGVSSMPASGAAPPRGEKTGAILQRGDGINRVSSVQGLRVRPPSACERTCRRFRRSRPTLQIAGSAEAFDDYRQQVQGTSSKLPFLAEWMPSPFLPSLEHARIEPFSRAVCGHWGEPVCLALAGAQRCANAFRPARLERLRRDAAAQARI
jgi:hypothetical protein